MSSTYESEWKARTGDIFQFCPQTPRPTEPLLLCIVLEDTPDTPEATTKVQFITGNKFMTKGYKTPVHLTSPSYALLEKQ